VGLLQKDRRISAEERVAPWLAKWIDARIHEGRRLVAFFGQSLIDAYRKGTLEVLSRLRAALGERDDWVVLLKPKGTHQVFYDWMKEDPRLLNWSDGERVIAVRYEAPGVEVCPAGWLIDRMAFGVCLDVGSIQVEGLVRGVPVFCFSPVWQDTPYVRKLVECGLLHDDADLFEATLRRYIDAPGSFDIPYDWFRERFDPFCDDQALLRVARVLLRREVGSNGGDTRK
jgi:hypothetical protein